MEHQLQHNSPSNEYSGSVSFGLTDLISLLSKTLKKLLQHHSSKTSVLQHSAFFMFQLSYLYMTAGKTIDVTRQTFVSKVVSLLFYTLSRFVVAFFPRNKDFFVCFCFQFHGAVTICSDFGAPEDKSGTVSTMFPLHLCDGTGMP